MDDEGKNAEERNRKNWIKKQEDKVRGGKKATQGTEIRSKASKGKDK